MNQETNASVETVTVDDLELSLDELAGIDLSEIKEVRSSAIPAGKFHWRITDAKLESREYSLDYDDPSSEKINSPVFVFELKAQNCFALINEELDPEDYMDVEKIHTIRIKKLKKDLGKAKAFLVDIGLDGNKSVTDLVNEAHGIEFVSDITNRANPDNPDFVFANLANVMSMEKFEESQAE